MHKDYLTLKRASASRSSGEWNDDDYDALANGELSGRILEANAGRNEVAVKPFLRKSMGFELAGFCFHHTQKGVRHVEVADGDCCACNRSSTCFGADHDPCGRRLSHRAERAELRCRDSR